MISRLTRVASIATAVVLVACVGIGFAQFGSTRTSSLAVSTLTLGLVTNAGATSADGCAGVTVSWTTASGADTYDVEVRRDLGAWTLLIAGAGDVASVEDATSGGAAQVEYRITPLHAASGWSGPVSTTAALTCV